MNKELEEALGLVICTCKLYIKGSSKLIGSDIIGKQINEALDIIQKQLESIDNSNPSEALEDLKELHEMAYGEDWEIDEIRMSSHIKQALIKGQEKSDKEIAFDLIDTKNVDIKLLKWAYPSVEAYNVWVREHKDSFPREELTKEEFDFLGRMVGAD